MVDASLRMSIVNLFKALRDNLGISIIYVTHDLATAYCISDRIIIMQKGCVVESGDARTVLSAPQHPYSRQLRAAVLLPGVAAAGRKVATAAVLASRLPVTLAAMKRRGPGLVAGHRDRHRAGAGRAPVLRGGGR